MGIVTRKEIAQLQEANDEFSQGLLEQIEARYKKGINLIQHATTTEVSEALKASEDQTIQDVLKALRPGRGRIKELPIWKFQRIVKVDLETLPKFIETINSQHLSSLNLKVVVTGNAVTLMTTNVVVVDHYSDGYQALLDKIEREELKPGFTTQTSKCIRAILESVIPISTEELNGKINVTEIGSFLKSIGNSPYRNFRLIPRQKRVVITPKHLGKVEVLSPDSIFRPSEITRADNPADVVEEATEVTKPATTAEPADTTAAETAPSKTEARLSIVEQELAALKKLVQEALKPATTTEAPDTSQARITELEAQLAAAQKEAHDTNVGKEAALKGINRQHQEEIARLKAEKIAEYEKQISDLRSQLQDFEQEAKASTAFIEKQTSQIIEFEIRIAELEEQLDNLSETHVSQELFAAAKQEITSKGIIIQNLERRIDDLKRQLENQPEPTPQADPEELQDLRSRLEDAQNRARQAEEKAEAAEARASEAEDELEEANSRIEELEANDQPTQDTSKLEKRISDLETEKDALENESIEQMEKIEELEARIAELQEELNAAQSSTPKPSGKPRPNGKPRPTPSAPKNSGLENVPPHQLEIKIAQQIAMNVTRQGELPKNILQSIINACDKRNDIPTTLNAKVRFLRRAKDRSGKMIAQRLVDQIKSQFGIQG